MGIYADDARHRRAAPHALCGHSIVALDEVQTAGHGRDARAFPLVGQKLGVGDAGEVAGRHA